MSGFSAVKGRAAEFAACLAVFALCMGSSQAGYTGSLMVQASNASGAGTFEVELSEGSYIPGGGWEWQAAGAVTLYDDVDAVTPIALLENLKVTLTAHPRRVQLVGIVAGGDSTTEFIITSPTITFPTIPESEALGAATITMSLTDTQGVGDSARIWGLPPGTGVFQPKYNGGTNFRPNGLLGGLFVNNGGTVQGTESDPAFGDRPVGSSVSEIRTWVGFTVTTGDRASVTTDWKVTPEPGTLSLLALGALFLRRR